MKNIPYLQLLVVIAFVSTCFFTEGQQDYMSQKWIQVVLNDPDKTTRDLTDSLVQYNFSDIWTKTENQFVLGFIGKNFERIRIKILSVEHDSIQMDTYHVRGKSMVRNNICDFSGVIALEKIVVDTANDPEYSDISSHGFVKGKYRFEEDTTQVHSGIFEGTLLSLWYMNDSDEIVYDDIILGADAFRNNQFYGTWQSYTTQSTKPCNWGDYRILNSGDLDIGAGLFSPATKYLAFGWKSYRAAYFENDNAAYDKEVDNWWE